MKKKNIEDKILYCPTTKEGQFLFDGIPYASMQILDIIGSEGIFHIDQKLKDYLLQRMEMFGTANKSKYGFSVEQHFFDLKEQILIKVKSKLEKNENDKRDYTIDISDDINTLNILKGRKKRYGIADQIKTIKRGVFFEE